jgi:hypothetical protein
MATNGGCRCWDKGREFHRADRLMLARVIMNMAGSIAILRATPPPRPSPAAGREGDEE